MAKLGQPTTHISNRDDVELFMVEYGHLGYAKLRAIELLATKRMNKMTYADIAEEIDVDPTTLFRWRNYNAEFQTALVAMSKAIFMAGVPDVFEFLQEVIQNGSYRDGTNAARLYLQAAGMLVDKSEVVTRQEATNVDAILAHYEEID